MVPFRRSGRRRSRGIVSLAIAACAGLLCLGQAAAAPAAPRGPWGSDGSAVQTAPAGSPVLYDQYDNPAGTGGINSQDYGPADTRNDQAADDFVVPTGQSWSISGVDADGHYAFGAGPALSVHVYFYANGAGNLPGTLVAQRLGNTYTNGPGAGDFVITLSSPVVLNPGTYWVSVQAQMDETAGGRWFWNDSNPVANQGAAWQQPGNAFGFNCTSWTRKISCNAGSPWPDQMFRLNGTASSIVLYDQYNSPAGTGGINSQDYGPSDTRNDQAADDFVVPAGQSWSISGVDADGHYAFGAGPALSVHVYFYANGAGNLPGTLVASRLSNTYTSGPDASDYVITLSSPVVLNPGTYWVSVQAQMDETAGGRWFWNDSNPVANQGAAWQQPGNAFGFNCTSWTRKISCNAGSPWPDQMFRLNGTVGLPTAVRGASISAKRSAAGVAISWRSRAEAGVLGFNVWRRAGSAGRWVKLNARLIGAAGQSGRLYRYLDRAARGSVRYDYTVDTVYLDGTVVRSAVVIVARR